MEGNRIKTVIFDMDGVIFDSEVLVCEIWSEIAKEYNLANMDEVMIRCIGVNHAETERIMKEEYGEDFDYNYYVQISSQIYHSRYDNGRLPMKEGVFEILEYLKTNGYKTALASSTRIETVTNQLKAAGIYKYFDEVIGGDMVSKSKPDPEIFLKAAEKLGVSPKEAYVIEDSFNGIRAAYSAGCVPFMVPDMLKPDDEMHRKAYRIFESLLEVRDFLSQ